MRLGEVLFRWKKPLPKGNIFRGKYRLVKQVKAIDMALKRAELDLEERNMFYLRHPYLTSEQACSDVSPLHSNEKSITIDEEKRNKFKKHQLLGDRFGFLKVADRWE